MTKTTIVFVNMIDNLGEIVNSDLIAGNFNIMHINAQSLVPRNNSAKFDGIKNIVENCEIDAFGVSETWYNDLVTDNGIRISGFKVFRNDRSYTRGVGVCLYVCESLAAKVVYDGNDICGVEAIFVEVVLSSGV